MPRSPSRGPAWIAGIGVTISALVLPIVTNVLSDQVPDSWAPYLWLAVPAGLLLTFALVMIGRRAGGPAPADGSSVQLNVTSGGTSYAVQNGDLHHGYRPGE